MMRKTYPSQRHLAELFEYDGGTGILAWLPRQEASFPSARAAKVWNTRFAGKPAGSIVSGSEYLSVNIGPSRFKAHVVAWIIHYGQAPSADIDHINGLRRDNRIANMRAVSRSGNMRNTAISPRNTSGVVGVSWNKPANKWQATVRDNDGKRKSLGYFSDLGEAANARKSAERLFGYHANHGRAVEMHQ
jgi:hypothetical protein